MLELDGRVVAARRIDMSSPEVALLGGLTVDPAYRGRGLARDVRLATVADLAKGGVRHCGAIHVGNARVVHREHRDYASWMIANLAMPPPPRWRRLVQSARARLWAWDRPCRRRRPAFTLR